MIPIPSKPWCRMEKHCRQEHPTFWDRIFAKAFEVNNLPNKTGRIRGQHHRGVIYRLIGGLIMTHKGWWRPRTATPKLKLPSRWSDCTHIHSEPELMLVAESNSRLALGPEASVSRSDDDEQQAGLLNLPSMKMKGNTCAVGVLVNETKTTNGGGCQKRQ